MTRPVLFIDAARIFLAHAGVTSRMQRGKIESGFQLREQDRSVGRLSLSLSLSLTAQKKPTAAR